MSRQTTPSISSCRSLLFCFIKSPSLTTSLIPSAVFHQVLLKDTVAAADENLSDAVAELEEMMGITEAASVRIFNEVTR